MAAPEDTSFARLVSLACHDLRTPLATAHGFARTLMRIGGLEAPKDRYVEMIAAASGQLAELLDDLALVARIEAARWEPELDVVDTLELARAAAERVGAERARATGDGAAVLVAPSAAENAVYAFANCALRHGGLESVDVRVAGAEIAVEPVRADVGPIIVGTELRDFGAAVAVRVVSALGGATALDGETLRVRLPSAPTPGGTSASAAPR
jgi:signal transduction histidine kinase